MNSFESLVSQFTYPNEKQQQAEELRRQFVERFPISKLASLKLEEYALGLEPTENSFCYWLEFKTRHLGSIGGGAADKFVVYYRCTPRANDRQVLLLGELDSSKPRWTAKKATLAKQELGWKIESTDTVSVKAVWQ